MKTARVILTIWCLLDLILLVIVALWLKAAFPIFTVIWIVIPLIVVWRTKDASQVGFRTIPWQSLVTYTGINLAGILLVMLACEPWSHTYQRLIDLALASRPPDATFAWLLRFPRLPGLTGLFFFSSLVTLFGEELFFRGLLLQFFQRRMGKLWAITLQAALFMLPNLLAAFALPILQGSLYAGVYTFAAIGLIGGWAAARTQSIWPSLLSVAVCNLVFVAAVLR